jgi:hypothetical protein
MNAPKTISPLPAEPQKANPHQLNQANSSTNKVKFLALAALATLALSATAASLSIGDAAPALKASK